MRFASTRCRTPTFFSERPQPQPPQPPQLHTRTRTRTHTHTHTRATLLSPAAATLHGKTQGFVLRLPPQSKPYATIMQPLQCVLKQHVSNPHVSTHMATKRDNNHAAIPLRSASPSFVITTSPPFVITTPLRHHFPQSPPLSSLPSVTTLRLCDVLLSDVKSHNSICL